MLEQLFRIVAVALVALVVGAAVIACASGTASQVSPPAGTPAPNSSPTPGAATGPTSSSASPTAAGQATPAGAATIPAAASQAVDSARRDLAGRGVSPDQITVLSVADVNWPDSALGCPQPGMMYSQVVTPGYKIVLQAGGTTYEYHTDRIGQRVVSCATSKP